MNFAALALVIAAMVDVLLHRDAAFVAAGKQTKLFWIFVLVLGAFITFVGAIAALVYFLDVRPALQTVGRGGGSSRGSSSDGPYGPYRG